jgi:serine/threonine protein kinase
VKKPTPFGKYYLLERINVGGMAEVFRAKAFGVEGFERLVAVKRILPNIAEDKEFIRMFIEEAKLAVQLNHANIAQIFDLGVVDGAYYIALEHVHGRDLRGMFDRCRQLGEPMPVAQACFIIMKLCEGLDYAHNKRDQAGRELHLVHRDVSPQNVLVSFEGEVKVIDFGIAKAANKGNKTQAGILKGKFGYMSPEQVRGIPIDRRSDVFSCGIVLYELLTGERLFVGESDFSTLEKVRNVEILPPSTYNRRIPDELERIVLKALAKDPEDRYQNAIDLHDELQAFVYTAGEFYSRKDLAGWMKKIFGREIEDETAKLESYRQLKAPAEIVNAPIVGRAPSGGSKPPVAQPRRTQAMAAVGNTKPPPPPTRASQQLPVITSPTAKVGKVGKGKGDAGELEWDDDELETQIYDDDNTGQAKPAPAAAKGAKGSQPIPAVPQPDVAPPPAPPSTLRGPGTTLPPPIPAAAMAASAAAAPTLLNAPPPTETLKGTAPGPDLSSLVANAAKSWDGMPAMAPTNGTSTKPPFANGSGKGPAPAAPGLEVDPISAALALPQPIARETSASSRMVANDMAGRSFDAGMPAFGSGMLARKTASHKNRGTVYIAIGGAALAIVAVVVVIAMTGGKKAAPTKPTPETNVAATPTAPAAQSDQNTGFDLYVYPAGVTTWRLDGETRTDKLPSRIRGITSGAHQVAIDAPPGFMSQNQAVDVELGKAQKVEIQLQPIAGIHGEFESSPPGATVSLIVDGKREALGASPAKSALDPRKTYQVLFEKAGYVSVNRPVTFTGALEEKVSVNLEKAGAVVADAGSATQQPVTAPITHPNPPPTTAITAPPPPVTHPNPPPATHDHVATSDTPKPNTGSTPSTGGFGDVVDKPSGEGTLLLGSKPPCDILVDGSSTGLHTPQRDMKLPAGKHKITLVNDELGIKETFNVNIQAGQTEKQIKDFSDKIKQP